MLGICLICTRNSDLTIVTYLGHAFAFPPESRFCTSRVSRTSCHHSFCLMHAMRGVHPCHLRKQTFVVLHFSVGFVLPRGMELYIVPSHNRQPIRNILMLEANDCCIAIATCTYRFQISGAAPLSVEMLPLQSHILFSESRCSPARVRIFRICLFLQGSKIHAGATHTFSQNGGFLSP